MVSELSILIPVYNYSIITLVNTLREQCQQAAIAFEIICLDDASESCFQVNNRGVRELENVVYEELAVNISRAAIRNVLAQRAQYKYLLFLDNDSEIISKEYLRNYLQAATTDTVFIGGTVYQPHPPTPLYRLHWQYGRQREQRSAFIRQQQPYGQVQVNNLFVNRALFLANPIPEMLQTYGHEDTLWGQQLNKAKIPISHLNNPIRHAGLEPTPLFLTKTEQAVRNLVLLMHPDNGGIISGLTKAYGFLRNFRAVYLFQLFFNNIKPLLLLQLRSAKPSLICLDIFKLGLLIDEVNKRKGYKYQDASSKSK